jgi:hypothetical protein
MKIVPASESIGLSKVLEDMTSAWKKMGARPTVNRCPPHVKLEATSLVCFELEDGSVGRRRESEARATQRVMPLSNCK